MDRLSALSAAFLSAEDVDPECSLVIGSFAELDGPAPSPEEIREHVRRRLDLAPRYRQRLHRTFLDLRPPGWEDDPDFDLDHHVRAVQLPTPGGDIEVADLVGRLMVERMDRHLPLWDITVCTELASGHWGLLCRVHHALADGVSGTALLRVLYDIPEGAAPLSVGVHHQKTSKLRRLAQTAIASGRGGVALAAAALPLHGPSVTGRIGKRRRYAWTELPLDSVHDVRRDLGVTINDVALSAVTAGFRALLLHRGIEPHQRSVRSLVPVSAWAGAGSDQPDNHVTLMLADLPVHLEDPVARVRVVHELVIRLRNAGEPQAGIVAQQLFRTVPYPLLGSATRLALRIPHHHLSTVTTNVPGPRQPLSCLGREVRTMLPYVPIADRVRIGIAMFTYCGRITFGVTGDEDDSDLDVLVDGIRTGWNALAGVGPAASKVPMARGL